MCDYFCRLTLNGIGVGVYGCQFGKLYVIFVPGEGPTWDKVGGEFVFLVHGVDLDSEMIAHQTRVNRPCGSRRQPCMHNCQVNLLRQVS